MTTRVPVARPQQTIGDVLDYISSSPGDFDTLEYVYVLDGQGKLVGLLPIEELFRASPGASVADLLPAAPLVTALPTTDQEHTAYLALEHEARAIPVVDDSNRFLGAVPSRAILAIIHKEVQEDLLHLAGVRPSRRPLDNILDISLLEAFRHRIPWLLVGLLGGVLAARVIGAFESTLERNLVLAASLPLIVYMADAVGTQMEAFAIRDFAISSALSYGRYFLKQFLVVLLIAVVTSAVLAAVSLALYGDLRLGLVLGVSLFCAIMSAMFTGLLIPYLFNRIGLDPANASGPIATIVQDILSILIYFVIATWMLGESVE